MLRQKVPRQPTASLFDQKWGHEPREKSPGRESVMCLASVWIFRLSKYSTQVAAMLVCFAATGSMSLLERYKLAKNMQVDQRG
ncbi:hypothetical protein B0H12DRAFT_1143438 [Mycena haematopus]|nr:hypothetical protein B0H12DRAFT_1143438 [Mycena haematopus]